MVLLEAYEQSAGGGLSFDEPITLYPRHYEDDPPLTRPAESPVLSIGEALRRMVVFSDNASALALVERLTPEAVAAAPRRFGLD
ncbi:MAG: serine hydrolase, partial [Chloroflexi bacterium]|nr:serine hydrolase [Chloroflexota bacterium]